MKIFSLILGILLIAPEVVYGAQHCKTEKSLKVAEQLAKLEPKIDLDIVDVELFPLGNIVAGYEYEVDSAYTKGLYSRSDIWQIKVGGVPEKDHKISEKLNGKLAGGIELQTIAKFIRFFKDPCMAMKAKPYSPRRIPLKSSIAIGPKFAVGDYFQFRGSAGIMASGELLNMLGSSFWGVNLKLSYLMQGFYQLHIVRLDQNKIRLKVIAHRGTTKEAGVSIGFQEQFDIFKINNLNNAVERFVNTNPIKIKVDQKKSNVLLVDYILDLSDPEVAEAYDKMLPHAKSVNNIASLQSFKNMKNLDANFLLDLTPLEKIYLRDYERSQLGRLQRNLKTSSNQKLNSFGLNVGNKMLGWKYDKRAGTALMALRQPNDEYQNYLLKSWETNSEGRFLISVYRNSHEEAFRALFTADDSYLHLRPVNITKHIVLKRSAITYSKFQELKHRMRMLLPDEIYLKIPWQNWTQTSKTKYDNFGLRFEYSVSPDLINFLPPMKASEIRDLFRAYLQKKELVATDFVNVMETDFQTNDSVFEDHLRDLSENLEKALDQNKRSVERVSYISELRSNPLFEDTSIGFLASLKPDMMEKWSRLDLDISSNQSIIDFDYGSSEMTGVYKKILLIKAALDDDALDPILEAESISLPKAG